jgi:hypothetical protein
MALLSRVRGWFSRQVDAMASQERETSRPWPPHEDASRIRWYWLHEQVYRGNHKLALVDSGEFAFKRTTRNYVQSNLCKALTDLLVSRVYGEGIGITTPEDAVAAQELIELLEGPPVRLPRLLLEAGRTASYCGDAVLKVRYDVTEQAIRIEQVAPEQWFPEWSDSDGAMIACTIGRIVVTTASFLWLERHELREGGFWWITHAVYKLRGSETSGYTYLESERVNLDAIPPTAGLPEETNTGLPCCLMVHFPARLIGQDRFGTSDYAGLLELQGELNWRRTQRSGVLDQFVRPIVIGPMLIGDQTSPIDGGQSPVDLDDMRYLERTGQDTRVEVVTWDADLTVVQETIRDLTDQFAHTAGVDRAALLAEIGGAVSGRALRLSQMRTQATALEKQQLIAPCVQQLIYVVTALAALPQVRLAWEPTAGKVVALDASAVTVTFGDGLPSDRMEDISEHEKLLQMRVEPRSQAAEELFGLPADEAEALIERVDDEDAAPDLFAGFTAAPQPITEPQEETPFGVL